MRRLPRTRPQPASPAGILTLAFTLAAVATVLVLIALRPGPLMVVTFALFLIADVLVGIGWEQSGTQPGVDPHR